MLGTIVNVITVIIGGTIGTFFGNRIRPEYSETFIKVMGFITACIGIQSAAGTKTCASPIQPWRSLRCGQSVGIDR